MKVTGSLQQRNGTYYTFIRVPDIKGKAKQLSKSTGIKVVGKNQKETKANERKANKILDERILELENRCATVYCDELFLKCVEDWLEVYKDSVKQNTWESYNIYYDKHIKPFFSQKKYSKLTVAEITPLHIESYVAKKRKEGQKVLSIKKHLRILNGTFERALRFGWIDRNPCAIADKPKVPYEERHIGKAYTPEQAQKLLQCTKGDSAESAIMLGLFLGLRKSECLGLRWSDIDFENNVVSIRNTVVRTVEIIESEQTKSKSSRRDLALPPQLRDYLIDLRAHQLEMKKLFGKLYHENNHVCQLDDGTMMKPDYPTRHLKKIIHKNDLPVITFHELRHSAGSILLNANVNVKQIQAFLGHSDIGTTLDIYTHLTKAKEVETSNILGDLLFSGQS